MSCLAPTMYMEGCTMKHPKHDTPGGTIGSTFTHALVSITITFINLWGKSRKKGGK